MLASRFRAPGLGVRLDVLLNRIGLLLSYSRRIDGLWVGCWNSDREKRLIVFGRVAEALCLIKQYDPRRYNRLRRDMDRIWVFVLTGNQGEYRDALKMCVLDERYVLAAATRPEQIASTIVHEATHARLIRCGIGYEEALRARVEAVCFRQQRAFAAKLPVGEPTREEAERRLTGYPSDFWTDRSFGERRDRGAAEALRHFGRSELFIRNFFRLREKIWRVHQFIQRRKPPFRRRHS
jgi:hypothetical protein